MATKSHPAKRTMSPPPGVAELLELVNELPPSANDMREIWEKVRNANPQLEGIAFSKKLVAEFENQLAECPQSIRDFVGSPKDPKSPYIHPDAAKRYSDLINAWSFLTTIASNNARAIRELEIASKPIAEESMTQCWASPDMLILLSSSPITLVDLSLNSRGELEWQLNVLVEVLQKARITRIRRCRVCNLFFWAGRIDQLCCSSQCANTYRQRVWRERYAKQYKIQRHNRANELEKQKAISSDSKSSKQKGAK